MTKRISRKKKSNTRKRSSRKRVSKTRRRSSHKRVSKTRRRSSRKRVSKTRRRSPRKRVSKTRRRSPRKRVSKKNIQEGGDVRDGDNKISKAWSEFIDESSGQSYYYNSITDESTWDRPDEMAADGDGDEPGGAYKGYEPWSPELILELVNYIVLYKTKRRGNKKYKAAEASYTKKKDEEISKLTNNCERCDFPKAATTYNRQVSLKKTEILDCQSCDRNIYNKATHLLVHEKNLGKLLPNHVTELTESLELEIKIKKGEVNVQYAVKGYYDIWGKQYVIRGLQKIHGIFANSSTELFRKSLKRRIRDTYFSKDKDKNERELEFHRVANLLGIHGRRKQEAENDRLNGEENVNVDEERKINEKTKRKKFWEAVTSRYSP